MGSRLNILFLQHRMDVFHNLGHQAFPDAIAKYHNIRFYGRGYEPKNTPLLYHINDIIKYRYGNEKPDLIIHHDVDREHVEDRWIHLINGIANCEIPAIMLCLDHHDYNHKPRLKAIAKHQFKAIFFKYQVSVNYYKYRTNAKCFWLPWAINPMMYRNWNEKKEYDVLLTGRMILPYYTYRTEALKKINIFIKQQPHAFKFFHAKHCGVFNYKLGRQSNGSFHGSEYSKLFNKAKMTIITGGYLRWPLLKYFEAMASNCLVLGIKPQGGETLFTPGKHYVELKPDMTDLISKINYYLKNPNKTQEIIDNAMKNIKEKHIWDERVKSFFYILKSNKII